MDDPWADAPPSKPTTPASTGRTKTTDTSSPMLQQGSQAPTLFTSVETVPADASASEETGFGDTEDTTAAHGLQDDFKDMKVEDPYAGSGNNDALQLDNTSEGDGFDDFDDFDTPAGPSGTSGMEEDGFGDFGEFEEGDFEPAPALPIMAPVEASFQPLSLRPLPSRSDLLTSLTTLLTPLYPNSTSDLLTSEPIRELPPSRQILITDGSREAYIQLASPPQIKPLDWTRSRVRREHLISMGVPVNLDEVDSHRLSAMPALTISTSFVKERPGSMPPPVAGRSSSMDVEVKRGSGVGVGAGPMSAAPALGTDRGKSKYGLGERPELDMVRSEELCGIEEDQLSLLPPSALKKLQDDLVTMSAQASARLAWELQFKDAQGQDSATYNGMISELIANAAKAKSAQQVGSGGVFRRSSQRRPQSGSGSATPRVGSPVVR